MIAGEIWNPMTGICPYGCVYCAERLRSIIRGEGELTLHKGRTIPFSENIFVANCLDLFADQMPEKIIRWVLDATRQREHQNFFFMTKNPGGCLDFVSRLPQKSQINATIESDVDYPGISSAPPQSTRLRSMENLRGELPDANLAIVIQPIMDFTPQFLKSLIVAKPNEIAISFDTRKPSQKTKPLIEPSNSKAYQLAKDLRKSGIMVEYYPKTAIKDTLERHKTKMPFGEVDPWKTLSASRHFTPSYDGHRPLIFSRHPQNI